MLLTNELKQLIISEYDSGSTYKELSKKYKVHMVALTSILRGRRSISDALKLADKRGRRIISEETRLRLSEHGKKCIRNSSKCWTKPEREFVNILRGQGIGVRFPDYMQELFGLKNDENATVFAQYPIQRYVCDFVEPEKKIIFRVNGDFWHGNPILYSEDKLTSIQTYNRKRDILAENYFKENGWDVVDIWESEIYWNKELVLNKISRIAQLARALGLHPRGSPFKSECGYKIDDWSNELKKLWFKEPRKKRETFLIKCTTCGKEINSFYSTQKFCSKNCRRGNSKCPSKDELVKLTNEMSLEDIGKHYGVSGTSVKKWIRKHNIEYKRKFFDKQLITLKKYLEKRSELSKLKHTCACGNHITNLRSKMCRKCWVDGKGKRN